MGTWRRGDRGFTPVNPVPGGGGYTAGTGPVNEQGFPGSGPAAPWLHGQSAGDVPHQRQTVSADQFAHDEIPHGNWTGQVLRNIATTQPRSHDTEIKGTIVLSRAVPGSQNQRNDWCYNRFARPDGVNRYVYGGEEGGPCTGQGRPGPEDTGVSPPVVNGGYSTPVFDRRMPYTSWGYGRRGSQNSGWRFYRNVPDQFGGWPAGHYGDFRMAGPRHRPTTFTEPSPWTASYFDTTASTGSATVPGTAGQQVQQIYVSLEAARTSWRRGT